MRGARFQSSTSWQKAHQLTLSIYRATVGFPVQEQYGLTSQIRRAAASIPANIAEGCGRDTTPEMARFLQIASGSSTELEYHLLLAYDLGFLNDEAYAALQPRVIEVQRMLTAFVRTLRS